MSIPLAVDGETDLDSNFFNPIIQAINTVPLTNIETALAQSNARVGVANVLDYGAVGDGSTDDSQAFVDAIADGYEIQIPAGKRYKVVDVEIPSHRALRGVKRGYESTSQGAIIQGVSGHSVFTFPSGVTTRGVSFDDLTISGGDKGIVSPSWSYGISMRRVTLTNQQYAGIYCDGAIERWSLDFVAIEALPGHTTSKGFQLSDTTYSGENYIDKCTFKDVRTSEGSHGWYIMGARGNSNTWINPVLNNHRVAGMHLRRKEATVIINPNTESNGGFVNPKFTTGSITTGTNSLVVASATGFSQGQTITVQGAGAGGIDLVTTISSIAGTTFTLADNASTSVTSKEVTNSTADDFVFDNGGGTGLSHTMMIGGFFGDRLSQSGVRYAINGNGMNSLILIGSHARHAPIYTPVNKATTFGVRATFRPADTPPVVTGSRGSNAALASLLTALAAEGLIQDGTS
ncbi:MAG: hypothetical protein IT580_22865 [Verrucomicrobiales bacterium]|nr:hypothetical protein [Verrucomicrobiales bacterium]